MGTQLRQTERHTQQRPTKRHLNFRDGLQLGLLAAVSAGMVNLGLLWLARVALHIAVLTPGPAGPEPVEWIWVMLATALPALLAPAMLALFLRSSRPNTVRNFRLLSLTLLAVSYVPIIALQDVDLANRLTLATMHTATAAVILSIVKLRV